MAQTQCVDLNLWSFIRNTQATQLASLKVLQKFILSLNKTELSHIINCYLRSKVSKYASFKATGLTFKQTEDQWANEEPDNEKLEVIDRHIISKLNAKYATKYQKKSHCKNDTTKEQNQLQSAPCVIHSTTSVGVFIPIFIIQGIVQNKACLREFYVFKQTIY
eukprot:595743_1